MGLILSVCEQIVVLDSGAVIADGPTAEVCEDLAVIVPTWAARSRSGSSALPYGKELHVDAMSAG